MSWVFFQIQITAVNSICSHLSIRFLRLLLYTNDSLSVHLREYVYYYHLSYLPDIMNMIDRMIYQFFSYIFFYLIDSN